MRRREFVRTVGFGGAMARLGGSTVNAAVDPQLLEVRPAPIGKEWPHWAEGRAHRMILGRNGVVAAADQLASLAGARMLMKGGNAVDAIVAAAAALNVVEPMMSGIAGFGGFMMIRKADNNILALDMQGVSPAASSPRTMTELDFDEGYKAPIVPGTLAGWAEALAAHGTMSLGDVFEPAIELAEGGYPITAFDANSIARSFDKLVKFPTTARIFLPNGKPPQVGWILKQPDLARTFRRIAMDGPDALYRGSIGDEIVAFLQKNGGHLTKQDLAGFKVRWRTPISTTFQGHELYTMPPGSCGMTMLQALNIMDGFDLRGMQPYSAEFVHRWLEAYKLAFIDDDRYNTGKEMEIPVSRLISKAYADEQRRKIRLTQVSRFPGEPLLTIGTTSLAAADRWGNAVAFTMSLVSGWGSGVVAGDTGLLLNNGHRFGFVLEPGHVNALAGGQRAKGVMSPTLVMRGDKLLMAIGAAGGYTIPQTVGQSITRVLAYGMDVQQAIASPRMLLNRTGGRVPLAPNEGITFLEPGFPESVGAQLQSLGHRLSSPSTGGVVQGVYIDPESGALGGGSDPRADGHPIVW